MNKGTDLKRLFNEYDSNQVMDMLDNLLIENSLYDEKYDGRVTKKRLLLNKDYHFDKKEPAIYDDSGIDPAAAFGDGLPDYLELGEDGTAPGLDPRIQPMG